MFRRINHFKNNTVLANSTFQRVVNGIILLALLCLFISISDQVRLSSSARLHDKSGLLLITMTLLLLQPLFNKTFLNSFLMILAVALMSYFVYAYVYFFFDKADWHRHHYGDRAVIIKSLELILKLGAAFCWILTMYLIRPNRKSLHE
jgi:hypothetical protein